MRRSKTTMALALALAPLALLLASCNILGGIAQVMTPPKKVSAVYEPPKHKRVLVFTDDRGLLGYEPIKRELTESINKRLVRYNLVADVVSYQELLEVRAAHPEFDDTTKVGVVDVGNYCKADLVLMVEFTAFRLQESANTTYWDGVLGVKLRWVDVHAPKGLTTLWPKDRAQGHIMPAVTNPPKEDSSKAYAGELTTKLAEKMAENIVKLFRSYEIPAGQTPESIQEVDMAS